MTKFCKDCAYYRREEIVAHYGAFKGEVIRLYDGCIHPAHEEYNLVTGQKNSPTLCSKMREVSNAFICGANAAFFKEKTKWKL